MLCVFILVKNSRNFTLENDEKWNVPFYKSQNVIVFNDFF